MWVDLPSINPNPSYYRENESNNVPFPDWNQASMNTSSMCNNYCDVTNIIVQWNVNQLVQWVVVDCFLAEEYVIPRCLLCGGFTEVFQDAVMWFSSGGTKSVLHFDSVENINCLFSGSKKFIMIDKVCTPLISTIFYTISFSLELIPVYCILRFFLLSHSILWLHQHILSA